jgi:tetratricopeptide (TPR) repeat protein
MRQRMTEELAMLQEDPNEQVKLLTAAAALAAQNGDRLSQVSVAETLFQLVNINSSLAKFTNAANAYEDTLEKLVKPEPGADAWNLYWSGRWKIGQHMLFRAKQTRDSGESRFLLESAERIFLQALTQSEAAPPPPLTPQERAGRVNWAGFGTPSETPLATRLFSLAEVQSLLGQREEAVATYGKLLALNSTLYSHLWIESLRIGQLTEKNNPAWRAAIEEALADFMKRGGTDEYECSLRHDLGVSYRLAGDYARSLAVLNTNLERLKVNQEVTNNAGLTAYELLLTAHDYQALGDATTSATRLRELVERYPDTGSGKLAREELDRRQNP